MEVNAPQKFVLNHPFTAVLDSLSSHDRVDGHSAGVSPITVRWLTKQNLFVNIGLVEIDKGSCEIVRNNNSFSVTDEQLQDAHESLARHVQNVGRQ